MKPEDFEPAEETAVGLVDPASERQAEPVEISLDERIGYDAQAIRVEPGDPRFDPVRTLAVVLLQLHELNADWPRVLVRRMNEVVMAARSAYVTETFLCSLAGMPIRGPEEIARSLGITKQAVSREVLDALARVKEESPDLARLLATCREHYHAMPPPPPRTRTLFALPRSMIGQATEVEVSGTRHRATLRRVGGDVEIVAADGRVLGRVKPDALKLSVALRDDGTMADDAFVAA